MNNIAKRIFNELKILLYSFCTLIPAFLLGAGSYCLFINSSNSPPSYFLRDLWHSPVAWGLSLFCWGIFIGQKSILKLAIYLSAFLITYYAYISFSIQSSLMIIGFILARLLLIGFPSLIKPYFSWFSFQHIEQKIGFSLFLLMFVTILAPKNPSYIPMGQNTATAEEAAAMINGAYCKLKKESNAKTGPIDLIQYMNYVFIDTSSDYKFRNGDYKSYTQQGWLPFLLNWFTKSRDILLQPCSQRLQCIQLHNGGILQFDAQQSFGGTASTNAIFFNLDPDGHHGPQGRSSFYQYFDGKLKTGETKLPDTQTSPTSLTSQDKDPKYISDWFKADH